VDGVALQKAGFEIRYQIMWRKPHFPVSRGHYTYQHEPCWYGVRKGRQSHWIGDHNASTVWDITLDKNVAGGHSTQKPLECMARPLRNHEGDVYEPFAGSGTTIVAAEQLGRRCYALEIEPAYVAICLERLSKMGCECRQSSGK
jgi:DNA modification methylase